jgi:protocatechuate 3,4-dioxygenase beta subunit
MTLFAGAGLLALVGCGSDNSSSSASTSASTTPGSTTATPGSTTASTAAGSPAAAATCAPIPEETAGPFPGDGSNGLNVLTDDGIVRRDIRASFGSASGLAQGVPLTINLTVLDTANGCTPVSGAAVYVWHCDIDGKYSGYSQGVTNENYLRGVQETDANGVVTFTSIYPGCYAGRWPHIHFEVYPSVAEATSARNKTATSQIALTADVSATVYATDGYGPSVQNLARVSLSSDNVFRDGATAETPSVTGDITNGYVITLDVPV